MVWVLQGSSFFGKTSGIIGIFENRIKAITALKRMPKTNQYHLAQYPLNKIVCPKDYHLDEYWPHQNHDHFGIDSNIFAKDLLNETYEHYKDDEKEPVCYMWPGAYEDIDMTLKEFIQFVDKDPWLKKSFETIKEWQKTKSIKE